MENQHQVHNIIILDESGSMQSIKKTIIEGFNEIVQTVKGIGANFPEQEHIISLVPFNELAPRFYTSWIQFYCFATVIAPPIAAETALRAGGAKVRPRNQVRENSWRE